MHVFSLFGHYTWNSDSSLSRAQRRKRRITGGSAKDVLYTFVGKKEVPFPINIERSHTMNQRPIGVTILAILAGVAAVLAAINALQFLGILPFFVGPVAFRTFNFFYALMWGLMVWVYIWLVQMLWRVQPAAWLFLVIVTIFELTLDFIAMLGASTWQDVSVSFLVNGIILLYVMLPGGRNAFGTSRSAVGAAS